MCSTESPRTTSHSNINPVLLFSLVQHFMDATEIADESSDGILTYWPSNRSTQCSSWWFSSFQLLHAPQFSLEKNSYSLEHLKSAVQFRNSICSDGKQLHATIPSGLAKIQYCWELNWNLHTSPPQLSINISMRRQYPPTIVYLGPITALLLGCAI